MQSASYKHQKRISMILSRVDRSESRDEIISSVQSQKQVATRSTAAIASHERPSTSSTALYFHRSSFCRCKLRSITGSFTFQMMVM